MARMKEKLLESYSEGYDNGYRNGYLDAVMESSWECADCGNTYDSSVSSCPNQYLDRAHTASYKDE